MLVCRMEWGKGCCGEGCLTEGVLGGGVPGDRGEPVGITGWIFSTTVELMDKLRDSDRNARSKWSHLVRKVNATTRLIVVSRATRIQIPMNKQKS